MTAFPGDLSTQRSVGQMQNDLDDFLAATQEIFGGGSEVTSPTAGALSISSPIVVVTGSGATAINSLTYTNGKDNESVVLLICDASASPLTITDGDINLRGNVNAVLTTNECIMLRRRLGTQWFEVTRYEVQPDDMQTWLQLGTAAFKNEGAGSGLDADTLQGNAPSAFLGASAQAADSALLQGLPASSFLQLAIATQQVMAGSLRSNGGAAIVRAAAAAEAFYDLMQNEQERARLKVAAGTSDFELEAKDGVGNIQARLRIDNANGDLFYENLQGALPEGVLTPGKLDALTLAGLAAENYQIIESGLATNAAGVIHADGLGQPIPGLSITIPVTGRWRLRAWVSHRPAQTGLANRAFLFSDGTSELGRFDMASTINVDDYLELFEVTVSLSASDVITLNAWRQSAGSSIDSTFYGKASFQGASWRTSPAGPLESLQTRTHITAERIL